MLFSNLIAGAIVLATTMAWHDDFRVLLLVASVTYIALASLYLAGIASDEDITPTQELKDLALPWLAGCASWAGLMLAVPAYAGEGDGPQWLGVVIGAPFFTTCLFVIWQLYAHAVRRLISFLVRRRARLTAD